MPSKFALSACDLKGIIQLMILADFFVFFIVYCGKGTIFRRLQVISGSNKFKIKVK